MNKIGSNTGIGETFEYLDSIYKVIEHKSCEQCAFVGTISCDQADCTKRYRKDHKDVEFELMYVLKKQDEDVVEDVVEDVEFENE